MFDEILKKIDSVQGDVQYAAVLSTWMYNWSLSISRTNDCNMPAALLVAHCATTAPHQLNRLLKNIHVTKHYPYNKDYHLPKPYFNDVIPLAVKIMLTNEAPVAAHTALLQQARQITGDVFWRKPNLNKKKHVHLLSEYNEAARLMEGLINAYMNRYLATPDQEQILSASGKVFSGKFLADCVDNDFAYPHWKQALQNTATQDTASYAAVQIMQNFSVSVDKVRDFFISFPQVTMENVFDELKKWDENTFYYLNSSPSNVGKMYHAASHKDHDKKLTNIYPGLDRLMPSWIRFLSLVDETNPIPEKHVPVLANLTPHLVLDQEQTAKLENLIMISAVPNKPARTSKNKI